MKQIIQNIVSILALRGGLLGAVVRSIGRNDLMILAWGV
jgi:hypothetical protein